MNDLHRIIVFIGILILGPMYCFYGDRSYLILFIAFTSLYIHIRIDDLIDALKG